MKQKKVVILGTLIFLFGWMVASYMLAVGGFLVRIKDNQAAKATFLQAINPFYYFVNPAAYYILFSKQK